MQYKLLCKKRPAGRVWRLHSQHLKSPEYLDFIGLPGFSEKDCSVKIVSFFLTVWKTYRQHRCGNWAITQNLTSSCHSKADALWINWVWHIAWACRRVETAKAPRFSANQSWIKYPELSGHIRTSLKFWTSKTVSTLSPTCNKFASTCKHESPFGGFLVSWNQLNAKMLTGSGVHMLCLCFYMPAVNDSGLWYPGSIPIQCPYCLYAGHWAV